MPYRFEGYNMNNKKIKVIVSSLILSLGLTGCSFRLIKDSNELLSGSPFENTKSPKISLIILATISTFLFAFVKT